MSRIALIGENSIEYVSALLDIWNSGDCAVLIDWRIPFETAYNMMQEAEVESCYIESQLLKNVSVQEYSKVTFTPFEIVTRGSAVLPCDIRKKYIDNQSNDEAVVIYSSGTMGKSKGIILSHYAISANADAIIDYMQPNEKDCLYITKSLSHSSTLTGELLVSLRSGMNVVVAPTIVLPRFVLSRIKDFHITILCLNPSLLKMYADDHKTRNYDLSTLRAIYCSGEVLTDKTAEYVREVFRRIDIFNVYGLSEAGPRVTAQTKRCCKSNSVGKPIKGVEIIVVSENGIPVKCGERGIIHVNTLGRYSRYISGKEKHTSLYNDWLNTGDVGYFDKNEELHITDRADDMIIINAHKIYPNDIERIILTDNRISDCVVSTCICNGSEVVGCLYVGTEECMSDLIHRLRNNLIPYEVPKKFVMVPSIPRNHRGKIDKTKVKDLLSDKNNEEI